MRFTDTPDAASFRSSVRKVLRSGEIADALAAIRESDAEPDPRPLYRILGRYGLLAVAWREEYGGRGYPPTYAGIVLEELIRHGVPDTVYVISIQAVAGLLMAAGSARQQADLLPQMARGELLASILYTEPEAGSDLTGMRTIAVRADEGDYHLSGTKTWSLDTRFTDVALCAAITGTCEDRPISLFLVDLASDGVTVQVVPSIAGQAFHLVRLTDVFVPGANRVGAEGEGRVLMMKTLSLERSGLDAAIRAERWCERIASHPSTQAAAAGLEAEQLARFTARAHAARLLAWKAMLDSAADPVLSAKSKWYSSELAGEIARWAIQVQPPGERFIDDAYREAPGLTLAGGTSEVMLLLVSSSLAADSST
jgi:alkylation response protein AidB-like acyl-CoA dehydrogenase